MLDENKDIKNGASTMRVVDLGLLGNIVWSVLAFVCVRRLVKTCAKALVQCIFRVLAQQHPDIFGDVLVQESRGHPRQEVFQAWKFQRTIDLHCNSLNCKACNSIRVGVEEPPKRAVGVIPSGSTVSETARELERHTSEVHQLDIQESTSQCGPSCHFDSGALL